jgi:hypothetical protein
MDLLTILLVTFTLGRFLSVGSNLHGAINRKALPDRILVSTSWDLNYSHSFAWSKARIGFDYSPLIIDSREQGAPRPKYFFFEEKYIHHEGFFDLINSKRGEFKLRFTDHSYSLDI